jgi:cytochrome c556
MKPTLTAMAAVLLAACGAPGPAPTGSTATAPTATPVALPAGAGWTGVTLPAEVIKARFELMEHVEELMQPIDLITVGDPAEPAVLRQNAEVIGAMLGALPHLFPPTTNLFDPKAAQPVTLAMPAIWQDFDSFHALAGAAVRAADVMANANTRESRIAASLALRAACDACHAKNLRPYPPPKILPSDYAFDFDAALRKP